MAQKSSAIVQKVSKLVFLTGTKIDLREDKEALQALADNGQSPLKREQGQKLANKIRAVKYLECSALTQRGLKQVRVTHFSLVYYSIGIVAFYKWIFLSRGMVKIYEHSLLNAGSICECTLTS